MIILLFEIWGYISITDKILTSSVVFVWITLQFWYSATFWSIQNTCMPTPDSIHYSYSSYHWGYQVIYSPLWNVIPLLIYWACVSWSLLFGGVDTYPVPPVPLVLKMLNCFKIWTESCTNENWDIAMIEKF